MTFTQSIIQFILAIMVFGAGSYIKYKLNERSFYRRNEAGVQEFDSYGQAVRIKAVEKIVWTGATILQAFAGLAGLAAAIFGLIHIFN